MVPAVAIIEDCGDLRRLLVMVLEAEGVRALPLGSLSQVRHHATDVLSSRVVVIDINLGPGQPDGVAVYRWLRDQDYAGKVFFLTGHAKNSPLVVEAAATGVPILEKPMGIDALVPAIVDTMAS